MDPKGHVAVVTGAASGLGAETAAQLAKAGAKVALLDISIDTAQKMAAQVGGVAIRCDVANADSATAALAEVRDKLGVPRILVSCALALLRAWPATGRSFFAWCCSANPLAPNSRDVTIPSAVTLWVFPTVRSPLERITEED